MSRGCFIFSQPANLVAKSFGKLVRDAADGVVAQPALYLSGSREIQRLAARMLDSHPLDRRSKHSRFDAPSQLAAVCLPFGFG